MAYFNYFNMIIFYFSSRAIWNLFNNSHYITFFDFLLYLPWPMFNNFLSNSLTFVLNLSINVVQGNTLAFHSNYISYCLLIFHKLEPCSSCLMCIYLTCFLFKEKHNYIADLRLESILTIHPLKSVPEL